MPKKTLKRNIFQRILGICATRPPRDRDCWTYAEGDVVIDLKRAPELSDPGGSIRLESAAMPDRLLVIHGHDGRHHVFRNKCAHMGRRLDPLPDEDSVQCCSIGRSTYDYSGAIRRGPAGDSLVAYPIQVHGTSLTIALKPAMGAE